MHGLALRLNGRPIHLPARSGRLRVRLDAAHRLVLGENVQGVTIHGRDGHPVVPFVVGYRHKHALGARLRLGASNRPAAVATLRVPTTGVDKLSVRLNGARVCGCRPGAAPVVAAVV